MIKKYKLALATGLALVVASVGIASADRKEKFDTNKDGQLDQAERAVMRAERLEKKFAKLDTNNDGVLSKAEFKAMKNRAGRRGGRGGKFRNKP